MPESFFHDWQLWEEMTFVLAIAILTVFCLGLGKLWWISRRNKKQEVVDEEKRVKIQQLRMSGQIVKTKRDNDVPFGVRALESGMEIDGIWVSRSNAPVPESLGKVRKSGSSPSSSVRSNDGTRATSSGEGSRRSALHNGIPIPAFRLSQSHFERMALGKYFPPSGHMNSSCHNTATYKPRRSSHLRFSSYGDIQTHQGTLAQLEGAVPPRSPPAVHRQLSSYIKTIVVDSSSDASADNERSSGSDSDGTLSGEGMKRESQQLTGNPPSEAARQRNSSGKIPTNHKSEDSTGTTEMSSTGNCSPGPPHSPPRSRLNPFTTPDISPIFASTQLRIAIRLPTDEVTALGETQWPLLSQKPPEPPERPIFRPGGLHVNKSIRKVNSGFEVLPAGTFRTTGEFVANHSDRQSGLELSGDNTEKRRSKKLQKKRRESLTGRHSPSIMEKP